MAQEKLVTIDTLSDKINSTRTQLDSLKKWISQLSDVEKVKKSQELKDAIESVKQELNALKQWASATDLKKINEIEKDIIWIEAEYQQLDNQITHDLSTLSSEVKSTAITNPEWKKNWLETQWDGLTSKEEWKENTWKNILRAVWWIWVVWWAVWLWKKLFWKKKNKWEDVEEEEIDDEWENKKKKKKKKKSGDEKTFREKPVWKFVKWTAAFLWIWSGVYYLAHGIYTKNWGVKDLFDWERWKKLEFDAALEYCKWAIANQNNKEGMSYGMNLKYHEETWEIEAYWEKIKIDKDKRKILWIWLGDVTFKKYEHMINTAILIAYLKKNYSWKCANDTPFHLTWDWQGDINVNTASGDEEAVDWTWNWWRIVWITAGWIAWILTWIFGWLKAWVAVTTIWWAGWYMLGSAYDHNNIMNDHMPELDNEFWKKSLWAYLNSLACRKTKNQDRDTITDSPIKDEVWQCIDEIQTANPELPNRWWRRNFDVIQDPNDKNKYLIKAYGRDISAEITWENEKTIRILWISGWSPEIKTDMSKWNMLNLKLPLKEWLYMSSLLWFFLENFHHKWNDYPRFEYTSRQFVIRTGAKYGIYFSDSWMDTYALTAEKFMEKMPTLFKEKKRFLEFLNDWITDESNVSIWKESK